MIIDKNDPDKYAIEYLQDKFDPYDFFLPSCVTDWRQPVSSLETYGVFFLVCNWVTQQLDIEEDFMDVYDNLNGWRDNHKGGSFNPHDDYPLYDKEDRLYVTDFVLQGPNVFAEITDKETDRVVGYILIHT